VQIHHIYIGYRQRGEAPRTVCADIDTTLAEGQLVCLIGPNGTGKSTLMRTLSAFQPPLQGSISIGGHDLAALRPQQLARLVSVVLTARVQVANISVRDLVGIGRSPYTNFWGTLSRDDAQVVADSMQHAGISHLADRMLHTLSDGERQKAMIAKALAQHTPYILLDEPTAFLDYPSKVDTLQMLRRLSHEQGKAILLSTHDVELALQLADRLWLMMDGHLWEGTPQELAQGGQLNTFLDGRGIRFDTQHMQIHVT